MKVYLLIFPTFLSLPFEKNRHVNLHSFIKELFSIQIRAHPSRKPQMSPLTLNLRLWNFRSWRKNDNPHSVFFQVSQLSPSFLYVISEFGWAFYRRKYNDTGPEMTGDSVYLWPGTITIFFNFSILHPWSRTFNLRYHWHEKHPIGMRI